MSEKKSKALIFLGFILGLNIFTFATDKIQFSYLVFYIGVASYLLYISIKYKIKFGTEIIILSVLIIYMLFSLMYTNDFNIGFRFTLFFIVYLFIGVILSKVNEWHESFISISLIMSSIHSAITIFAYFYQSLYIKMFFPLFSNNSQLTMRKLLNAGAQVGLTNQTANNAFLISIGLGILLNSILNKKNSKAKDYILLIVHVISLMMTLKRSLIIANILSSCLLIFITIQTSKKGIKVYFKILVGIISLFVILFLSKSMFPVFNKIIERFEISGGGDYTSGRIDIYRGGLELFKKRPIIGNGIYSTPSLLGSEYKLYGKQQMHNIYLQLLAELGLIGTLLYIIPIVYYYIETIKILNHAWIQQCYRRKYILGISLYIQTLWLIYGMFGNPFTEHVFLLTYLVSISMSLYFKNQNSNLKVVT